MTNKLINKLKEQVSDVKLLILNLVIVALAVGTIAVAWMTIREVYDVFAPNSYYRKENSFIYAMEREGYGEVVSMYYDNCRSGQGDKRSLQEYYGVAKYYEAAFYYKIYAEAGDTQRAQMRQSDMEEAALQMGDFAFLTEQIDEKLGIAE